MGENPESYPQGLLHAKPITYWDYIEVDTLLSFQRPRSHFEDETVFTMYHQVTELLPKIMRHEIRARTKYGFYGLPTSVLISVTLQKFQFTIRRFNPFSCKPRNAIHKFS